MEIQAKNGTHFVTAAATETASILNAAQFSYGWIGGLDSVRELLDHYPNSFSQRTIELGIKQRLDIPPLECFSITGHGLRQCCLDNIERYSINNAFGGDPRTQLMGYTICALSHEIEPMFAVSMFLRLILPSFVGQDSELCAALSLCLLDDTTIAKITNEGSARGMHRVFNDAAEGLKLPTSDPKWNRELVDEDIDFKETYAVAGMLKWLLSEEDEPYYTGNNHTTRVAAYLKKIGYRIDAIVSQTELEQPIDSQGRLVIFIHDYEQAEMYDDFEGTDLLALTSKEMTANEAIIHYRYESVGSMIFSRLTPCIDLGPEALQEQFVSIYHYIKSSTRIKHCLKSNGQDLLVQFKGTNRRVNYSRTAFKLAKIYFPLKPAYFAPCYMEIATEELYRVVREANSLEHPYDELPAEVARFRAVTASIIVAFLGNVAADDFEKTDHITRPYFLGSWWIEEVATFVNEARAYGVKYGNLIRALAVIHCSLNHEDISLKDFDHTVGWRNGAFGVLPDICFNMRTSESGLDMRLINCFWANVVPDCNGAILSAFTPISLGWVEGSGRNGTVSNPNITIGMPRLEAPDTHIDVEFERPLHYDAPLMSLVGRVNGNVLGGIGMSYVLRQLVYAYCLEPRTSCPGHDDGLERSGDDGSKMVIAKTSVWRDLGNKPAPVCRGMRTYTPALGHENWALFLLVFGQSFDTRIIRGCVRCVEAKLGGRSDPLLLIGLGQDSQSVEASDLMHGRRREEL